MILLLADGLTWAEIRNKLDCSNSYIDRWSKRFEAERLADLFSRHAGRERYNAYFGECDRSFRPIVTGHIRRNTQ